MTDAPHACEVCGETDDSPDHRTVRISMLYDLAEAGLRTLERMQIVQNADGTQVGSGSLIQTFGARVCKDCRGDLIGLLRRWKNGEFHEPEVEWDDVHNEPRNIPVRVDGRTVMVSHSEWKDLEADG